MSSHVTPDSLRYWVMPLSMNGELTLPCESQRDTSVAVPFTLYSGYVLLLENRPTTVPSLYLVFLCATKKTTYYCAFALYSGYVLLLEK